VFELEIIKLGGKGYASNTYILRSGSDAAVIDPSCSKESILDAIGTSKLRYVILTHGHFDHILTLDSLRSTLKCEVIIHKNDFDMLCDPAMNASDFFGLGFASLGADTSVAEGDSIILGRETIQIIETPGHTPGSICLDCGSDLICGDTLFSSGYGRYDLPGGNPQELFNSLSKLAQINTNPMIHPGHGTSVKLNDAHIIKSIRYNNF